MFSTVKSKIHAPLMQNVGKKQHFPAQNQTEMTTKSAFDHCVRADRIPNQVNYHPAQCFTSYKTLEINVPCLEDAKH